MNRRPNQSRSDYDAFSPHHAARFHAHAPDADFFERRRRRPLWQTLLLALTAALALFFAANFLCNQFVFVDRVSVAVRGLGEAFDGFTILHITDLKGERYGAGQSFVDFAIGGEEFDLVLITGDMLSPLGNAQPLYELLECLRKINSDAPIYYIAGDRAPLPVSMDYAAGGSPFAPWVLGAAQRGAQLLSSPVFIEREGQRIWLTTRAQTSLDIDAMQGAYEAQYLAALASGDENAIEMTAYQLRTIEGLRTARAAMTAEDIYITLTHTLPGKEDAPALRPAAIPRAIDLMLGGHYLGGLVRLPFLGPLFVPSAASANYGILPGGEEYGGLHRRGATWLYAGTGLGKRDEMYPGWFFRLLNPPSVALITLTPSAL